MKKIIFSIILLFTGAALTVSAQGGGFQQQTPEESTKNVMAKLDSAFKFDEVKKKEVNGIFLEFYEARAKMMEEARSSGDFQGVREKMQPFVDARDVKLKTALGEDNYKIWKEKIEPTMRGGGRGPRNN